MKKITLLALLAPFLFFAQPVNDDCLTAIPLTINDPYIPGSTVNALVEITSICALDVNDKAVTRLKLLNKEERIIEVAEMIGGKESTVTAINHAKELLN